MSDDRGIQWWQTIGCREEYEARATAHDGSDTGETEMALIAADNGGSFKPVPQGVHMARCYRVIDLGTQETNYQGELKAQRKIIIGWELFGEDEAGEALTTDDGKPMTISKRYTLSLSRNARLRADLESWRGRAFTDQELRGFDVGNLLGVYCMVNVTHDSRDGKTYSNIASISPVPAMLKNAKPAGIHPNQTFDVTDPDMAVFETFHDKLKELIQQSFEWRAQKTPPSKAAQTTAYNAAFEDEEIPF